MHVGILTDFPSIAVQSGPALHTRFLHDGLRRRGHEVTLMGPDTNEAAPVAGVRSHLFRGVPYPSHPNVKVVVPRPFNALVSAPPVDVIHGQTNNHVIEWANWMRKMHRTAVINTHIIHLPTHSHFILSDRLYQADLIRGVVRQWAEDVERDFARMYNEGDGLVVQSRFMVDYWRERGVETPIWVVGRPIDPSKFSAMPGSDPFPSSFTIGKRIVCVCRQDREKNLEQLIDTFDQYIAPTDPEATLTLIGAGHDHENLRTRAARGRYADRVLFPGEIPHARLVDWYAHASLFAYTSLSETFGNVVNEALWCGLPVVALDDRMGVAHQVVHEGNGFLVAPHRTDTDAVFGAHCVELLNNPELHRTMAAAAATHARRTSAPDVVVSKFERIYEQARQSAHDAVPAPLAQQSVVAQRRALARHVATWARWNYSLLLVGNTLGRLGFGRQDHKSEIVAEPAAERIPAAFDSPAAHLVAAE
ncbi:MAG: glycosyltransferase [Myxococcales bacterium]|nr:glycosyltransferase [Myxococcales bacterium]MCB9521280.1 glycosyltransferase [Myxococcales bacterium]